MKYLLSCASFGVVLPKQIYSIKLYDSDTDSIDEYSADSISKVIQQPILGAEVTESGTILCRGYKNICVISIRYNFGIFFSDKINKLVLLFHDRIYTTKADISYITNFSVDGYILHIGVMFHNKNTVGILKVSDDGTTESEDTLVYLSDGGIKGFLRYASLV